MFEITPPIAVLLTRRGGPERPLQRLPVRALGWSSAASILMNWAVSIEKSTDREAVGVEAVWANGLTIKFQVELTAEHARSAPRVKEAAQRLMSSILMEVAPA